MFPTEETLHRHVVESNAIENVAHSPYDSRYYSHMTAARLVTPGLIIHPHEIHTALGYGVPYLNEHRGIYRVRNVAVGQHAMPDHTYIEPLMDYWLSFVRSYEHIQKSNDRLYQTATFLHDWFLCIHPYQDGNGRTARLVKNMLLRNKGIDWHTDTFRDVVPYYARIRKVEEYIFKNKYPDVYPS